MCKTCKNCAYWSKSSVGRLRGECRYSEPSAYKEAIDERPWPTTWNMDWCRKFKARKKKTKSRAFAWIHARVKEVV